MLNKIKQFFTSNDTKDDFYVKLHYDIIEMQQRVEVLYKKVCKQHDDIQNFINSWTEK